MENLDFVREEQTDAQIREMAYTNKHGDVIFSRTDVVGVCGTEVIVHAISAGNWVSF